MANLIIDNTTKSGWITFVYNETSEDLITSQFPTDNIDGVDLEIVNSSTVVELYISHFKKPLFLCVSETGSAIIVDTVNGVVPTSIDDLKDKILALL
jgi:hypothetical protein